MHVTNTGSVLIFIIGLYCSILNIWLMLFYVIFSYFRPLIEGKSNAISFFLGLPPHFIFVISFEKNTFLYWEWTNFHETHFWSLFWGSTHYPCQVNQLIEGKSNAISSFLTRSPDFIFAISFGNNTFLYWESTDFHEFQFWPFKSQFNSQPDALQIDRNTRN